MNRLLNRRARPKGHPGTRKRTAVSAKMGFSVNGKSSKPDSGPGPDEELYQVRLYREDLNFSAGHISTYGEEVEGQHGHNYQLSLTFEGHLNQDALVIDFRRVKAILRRLLRELNHRTLVPVLNPRVKLEKGKKSTRIRVAEDWLEFPNSNLVFLDLPNITAEMLARHFHRCLWAQLPAEDSSRLTRISVEIIESPGQSAVYSGSSPGRPRGQ